MDDCPVCGNPLAPHGDSRWCSVYGHHREYDDPVRLPMIGQKFDNVRRVVVLFEADGRQYGWEITPPNTVGWEMTGTGSGPSGSTHARITVEGEFHRLTRQAPNPEIGEIEP